MAMLGCRLIGLDEPTQHDQIKKLIVFKKGPYSTRIQKAKKEGFRGDAVTGIGDDWGDYAAIVPLLPSGSDAAAPPSPVLVVRATPASWSG